MRYATEQFEGASNPQEKSLMKLTLSAFLLCASLACTGQVWATGLPDSCGDDKVKFDVKTEKGQPAPAGPAEGKAQIVFIQSENQPVAPFHDATVRFGMDGAWVGATQRLILRVDSGPRSSSSMYAQVGNRTQERRMSM
jgi:hypothetical protein